MKKNRGHSTVFRSLFFSIPASLHSALQKECKGQATERSMINLQKRNSVSYTLRD